MSILGLGAIFHYLGGGSPKSASDYYGRKIVDAKIDDNRLLLRFDDDVTIALFDNGQSCCESRYMSTDDEVSSLVGNILKHIEAKAGPSETGKDGNEHDTCFVEVATNQGFITLVNHNEHNGYYGGFGLSIKETVVQS